MTLLEPTMSMEIALLVLIALALLKYIGVTTRIMRGIGFLLIGVIFLFLDVITGTGFWTLSSLATAQSYLGIVWQVIAWIMFLLAALFTAIDVMISG